jgi:hypothetical protein
MHRAQTIHAIDISFSAVNEKTRSVVANNCLVPCRDWEVDARFEWASRTANRASVAREGELRESFAYPRNGCQPSWVSAVDRR